MSMLSRVQLCINLLGSIQEQYHEQEQEPEPEILKLDFDCPLFGQSDIKIDKKG